MPLRKQSSILTFALMLTLSVAPELLTSLPLIRPAQAQSPTSTAFPLPSVVPSGTTVRVDGSESMEVVNRALKQRFETEYPGTVVNLAAQGTDSALQGILNGTVDLAAVGRPLTDAELSQGLVEAPISREKIAIIVGADNPFQGDLTFEQFARMFRGEIRDWSEVGGAPGPIRFIDRPADNDTRRALSNYSVFKTAPFEAGPDTTQVGSNDTAAVVSQLGRDGISYAVASQVLNQPGVKVIRMHGTLPDDPRYPYSQPRNYVYKSPASPAIAAFLGFAGSPVGQQAVAEARSAAATAGTATLSPTPVPEATAVSPSPTPEATPVAPVTGAAPGGEAASRSAAGMAWWPWLLLPLAALVGLLLWGRRGRGTAETGAVEPSAAPPATPLAERTGSVITADRSSLPERSVAAPVPEPSMAPVVEPPNIEPPIVELPPAPTVEPPIVEPPAAPTVEPPAANPVPLAAVALGGAAAAAGLVGLAGRRDPQSRIVLTPRTADLGYAYWEAPEAEKAALRQQGGERFTLKIADVTDLAPDTATPHNVQQYDCAETDVDQFVPLPQAERDYVAEIGYFTPDQRWLMLARSAPVRLAAPTIAASVVAPDAAAETAMPRAAAPLVVASDPTVEEVPAQTEVEAARFNVGQTDLSSEALASVDAELPDLPAGYGTSWITLLPRDPQWAYAYWEVPDGHKQALRQQGGQRLALRFYDVTAIDLRHQNPHSLQQYDCDEMARDWYIPVPVADRDYIVEIGYVTEDGRWLMLARSNPIKVPPVYPSDWYEERFLTVDWNNNLQGETFLELLPPNQRRSFDNPIYDHIFGLAESAEAQRVAGSLFGSMQQAPPEAVSSFASGSGAGLVARTESGIGMSGIGMMSGAGMYTTSGVGMSGVGLGLYTTSGIGMSGVGMSGGMYTTSGIGMSGVGMYTMSGLGMLSGIGMAARTESGIGMMSGIGMYTMSGIGMSGIGMSGVGLYSASGIGMSGVGMYTTSGIGMSGMGLYSASGIGMSGIGFSASMPPLRSRKFWLLANAELIIYGATEPDATVTIAGQPVKLNPDGTFRFHLSFQDGMIDFPILAVAADGVQTRSIHMQFNRETLSRFTNSKEEAQDEPF